MKVKAYRTMMESSGYPYLVAENGNYICDGRKRFDSPETVHDFCVNQLNMDKLADEYVYCLVTNTKCNLMGVFEVGHGTVDKCPVSAREIFQKILLMNGTGFIMVHNHPSGDPTASREDIEITQKVNNAAKVMDIPLLDHVIIGDWYRYCSMKCENLF